MSGNDPRSRGGGGGRGGHQFPFHPRGTWRGGSDSSHERGRGRGDGNHPRSGRVGTGGVHGRGRGRPGETEVYQSSTGVPQPDPRVVRIEHETEHAHQLVRSKSKEAIDPKMPQRPGFGTQGKTVILWTNYFRLVEYGELVLHRYSIEIVESGTGKSLKGKKLKRVIQLFLKEHLAQNGHETVTDFKSNLLSKTELNLEPEYTVTYLAEGEDNPAPNAKLYNVSLQPTGTLTVSELFDYLSSSKVTQLFGSKEEIIQALNITVGHHPKEAAQIASIGANKHFQLNTKLQESFDLGAGLTALRGFFISVRAATARILVNVQVKHGAFFNDGPLNKLMLAFLRENGSNKFKLWSFLKRISVEVTHIVKLNKAGERVPRIKQLDSLASPGDGQGEEHPPIVPEYGAGSKDVKFFLIDSAARSGKSESQSSSVGQKSKGKQRIGTKSATPSSSSQGKYISVYDYFKQRYPRIAIEDPSLPVVNVGNRKNPSYLPPDVCLVLPGQPSNSKLSASQTQQMIRFAVRKPTENVRSIVTNGAQMLGFDPNNATLNAFGLKVIPNLITVPGRVLSGPNVIYHNKKMAMTRFGSWNMAETQFTARSTLSNWTFLWISIHGVNDPWGNPQGLKPTIQSFTTALRNVGITAADCSVGIHITVDRRSAEAEIDTAIHRFTSTPGKRPPELVLVILPLMDTAIYNRVKYACDVKEGLLNVCVVASKFAKANHQYNANVALKVNLKLGGQNQHLDDSKLGIIAEGKTMVVGIDVTHPAPGSSSNAPSVASIVASIDSKLAQWPGDLRIQAGRKEMVTDLEELFKSRLRLWREKNGSYPENVLLYRDGVSEGQYDTVLDEELPALQKASKELYPAPLTKRGFPLMTIIIVGKRHNTRFYPTKKEDADRSSNPQNGTVVDRGVTEARNWDFFLQAHAAIQGTARPAHYYIVYDQIFSRHRVQLPFNNAADALEDLTHNMCYLFGRATKAVSICPPAYYADLACTRARCYIGGLMDSTSDSPTASIISGQTWRSGQTANQSRVKLHDNVKDSMFYI